MRAIRVEQHGGPEVLMLRDLPDPIPAADQVLVEIKAAGVNPVDTYLRAGTQGYAADLPYTPGFDAAGIVGTVGDKVAGINPGSRVYVCGTPTGTYAEKCLCYADQVFALPESVAFAHGAAIGIPYATAFIALRQRAGVKPGQKVMVHGASGGVGLAAVQLCAVWGALVYGTAGSEAGLSLVRQQGAAAVANHREHGYLQALLDHTDGRGFDVIVEMLAHINLDADLKALAPGGQVIVVGSRGAVEITPRDLMARDASVKGFSLFNLSKAEKASAHLALADLMAQGKLSPVLANELALADAAQAHALVMRGGALGKVVLVT